MIVIYGRVTIMGVEESQLKHLLLLAIFILQVLWNLKTQSLQLHVSEEKEDLFLMA